MKVVAAVNGLITAEVAAIYAVHYAALHGFSLVLLHVENPYDSRDDVERSMTVIEEAAAARMISVERIVLEGRPIKVIRRYLAENRVDILFCSTSKRRRFLWNSLRDQLSRQALASDLAVVQVVRLDAAHAMRRMVLSIQEDRLSVKKFALFAAFARAYEADTEIYSVTVLGAKQMAELDIPLTRARLRQINDRLSHYVKLASFMDVPLRIKHAAARNEIDQVLHHLSHHDFQLMIVGGRRLSRLGMLLGSRSPLERLLRETPINTVAFYGQGKG